MITYKQTQAILALYPNVKELRGEIAFDENGVEVVLDMNSVDTKITELQAEDEAKEQEQIDAKASGLAKLSALGLTDDEIKAITG